MKKKGYWIFNSKILSYDEIFTKFYLKKSLKTSICDDNSS